MHAMQQTALDAVLDRSPPKPELAQLTPGDQRILAGGDVADRSIDMNE